jgi:dihydrofolate reductase
MEASLVCSPSVAATSRAPRPVILYIATSVDGFIAYPDGNIDWLLTDEDYGYLKFYESVDTLLMGRRTYDQILGFGPWPYGEKETYVFTASPPAKAPSGAIHFVSTDAVEFVQKVRQNALGAIWLVGGADLATTFQQAGLITEMIISVHPRLLGQGIALFHSMFIERPLKLLNSRTWPNGLCQLHYQVKLG